MVAALKELKAFSHIPVFTEAVLSYQAGDLRSNLPFEHFLGRTLSTARPSSHFSLFSPPPSYVSPNTCIFPSVSFTLPAINKTQWLPSGNLVGKPKNQSICKSKNCKLVGAEMDTDCDDKE